MSDVETQIQLEQLTNKNQALPRLRSEFRIPEIVEHCTENRVPVDFAIDFMAHMVLHKRANVGMAVGILRRHFGDGKSKENLQACADMCIRAAEIDLVDWNHEEQLFVIRIDVSDDVYEDLARYQYPMPMVVPPKLLKGNRDTGYYTHRTSVLLKDNHHEDDVCLDHLNRVNSTPLTINMDTAMLVKNHWEGINRAKPGETDQEYLKRRAAFDSYNEAARDVMDHLIISGNRFYLTHRYDKRGRCYAQGYHVTSQGNDWNKSVLEFADGEVASESADPLQWEWAA